MTRNEVLIWMFLLTMTCQLDDALDVILLVNDFVKAAWCLIEMFHLHFEFLRTEFLYDIPWTFLFLMNQ